MKIWGKQKTDECPWCGEREPTAHVLQCHNLDAIQHFQDLIDAWMSGWVKQKWHQG